MPLRLPLLDAVTRDMTYITSRITPGKSTSPTSPDGTSDPRLQAWVASQSVPLSQPPSAMPGPSANSNTTSSGPVRPGLQRSQTTLTRTSSASHRVYESRMSADYSIQRSSSKKKRNSTVNPIPESAQVVGPDARPVDLRRSYSSTTRPATGTRESYSRYDAAALRRPSGDARRTSGDSRESGSGSPGTVGPAAGYG
ncbi:Hypothetical protein D9617_13g098390 [Elsinoe fawcettii]|nr:Hypothetical protein D9617_13g098390 [Elsinoe fawcettii]